MPYDEPRRMRWLTARQCSEHAPRWWLWPRPRSGRSHQPGPSAAKTAFPHSFDGRFKGIGSLERVNGSGHTLTCRFNGTSKAGSAVLDGRCSAAVIFSASMRIDIQYNPGNGRYTGSFRESLGTVAHLAGSRTGETLSLAFTETAESVRPDPPARLTITRRISTLF